MCYLQKRLTEVYNKNVAVMASVDGDHCLVRFFSEHTDESLWFSTDIEKYSEPVIIAISDAMWTGTKPIIDDI